MVIGLRMGLIALRLLDSNGWFNLSCTVTLKQSPPESCVLDGIQSSSGCTFGKGNITVVEGDGVSAVFRSGSKRLRVILRPEIYGEVKRVLGSESKQIVEGFSEEITNRLIETEDYELFKIGN